jgi:hypothetical protein
MKQQRPSLTPALTAREAAKIARWVVSVWIECSAKSPGGPVGALVRGLDRFDRYQVERFAKKRFQKLSKLQREEWMP